MLTCVFQNVGWNMGIVRWCKMWAVETDWVLPCFYCNMCDLGQVTCPCLILLTCKTGTIIHLLCCYQKIWVLAQGQYPMSTSAQRAVILWLIYLPSHFHRFFDCSCALWGCEHPPTFCSHWWHAFLCPRVVCYPLLFLPYKTYFCLKE